MINSGRLGATPENYPLGGELPDINFDLTTDPNLNGDAEMVEGNLRAVAGVTLALAGQQIKPHDLRNLESTSQLSVKVLIVPRDLVGVGMPMQFGAARAQLDFHMSGRSLTISGRKDTDPTVGAQFGLLGTNNHDGRWVPERAYAGERPDYATVQFSPRERDPAHRGAGYARLIMAARGLGEVATHAIDLLSHPGAFGIQVEVNGRSSVTPMVYDPVTAAMRFAQQKLRLSLLSGVI